MKEKKPIDDVYAHIISFILCPFMKFFVSLYTHYVDKAGLKLTEAPVSASQALGGTTNL